MKAHYEKLATDVASLLIFERIDRVFPFHWHFHPEFELTLILNGQGQRLVGDGIADYGPGDLVLLGPNLPHSWRSVPIGARSEAYHRAVVIQFQENFPGEDYFRLEAMAPVRKLLVRSASGISFGHTRKAQLVRRRLTEFPSLSSAHQLVGLLNILLDLASEADGEVLSTNCCRPVCRVEEQHRIDSICSYLTEHFEEEIDFAGLSRRVHMDQASLCRFFKRTTGRTMTTYVNELRVGAAAQLLIDTDRSTTEIGFQVGFGNYSNFHRQFKRIKGCAPRVLRRQFVGDGR
jgi:AraC-like DNA-binding protein